MKLVLGLCLVAGIGLSAIAVADGRAPDRPRPRREIPGQRATVYRDNPSVAIGPVPFDVRLGAGIQIPRGWTHGDTVAGRDADDPYRLVKFAGPVGGRARGLLAARGFVVVAYYPYSTFLVRAAPGHALAELGLVEGVSWIGPFHPFFKLDRELAAVVADGARPKAAADPAWGERYVVGLHESDRAGAVAARIAAIPGVRTLPTRGPLRVAIEPSRLVAAVAAIAALPDVAYIETWLPPATGNDENVQTSQSGNCNPTGPEAPNTSIFSHGITGWNARIAIADTCVDANEGWFYDNNLATLPAHEPDAPWNSTPADWAQRKIVEYYDMYSADTTMGCGGTTGCGGVCPDHGTHVAGSAAGNCNLDLEGIATPTDPANRDGDNDGAAPGARLIAQDMGNGTLRYLSVDGGDLGELIEVAFTNTCDGADCGIDAHNNSWNSSTDAYETNARTADAALWSLKDLVTVISVGNAGVGGYNTMRAPATGKNVIGVGSAPSCSTQDVVSVSGRGDTSDGRLKPDVVAGGDSVTSALNDGDGSTNHNGGCQVTSISGTSMASGTVSGLTALVVQYFADGFYPGGAANPADALDPSGMLLKAMLINTARRMTGSGAEPDGVGWPNMDQGFGYVILDNALYFTGESRKLWVHDEPVGVDVSGVSSLSFQRAVTSGAVPLKVTLVWYDREYAGSCGVGVPCLINDLDLTVTNDTTGQSYTVTLVPGSPGHLVPRTVVPAGPLAGQTTMDNGPDDRNSVEQIIVYSPTAPANYTFSVTAASTPDGPIPFALVATGALDEPCPEPSAPADSTATDLAACFDTGVAVQWAADPPDWADGGSGPRFYQVLRDGVAIASGGCAGLLDYGTTSCVDDSAPDNIAFVYTVRYRNACGGTAVTAGETAADRSGPLVDVTPDGSTATCPGSAVLFAAAVDPPGGSYTYQWFEGGSPLPGETGPSLTVSHGGAEFHSYNCSVTDTTTGCEADDVSSAMAEWTTNFSDVEYDAAFDPLATLAQICGDGDAVVEAGEVWRVRTRLENGAECGVAPNVRADLAVSAGSGVAASLCGATGYYGTIAAGGTATHDYAFEIDPAATCGADASFDVTEIWWGGGAAGAVQPAFDFQVGQPSSGSQQTATQLSDPLAVSSGSGFSTLVPALTLTGVTAALLDYDLACGPGPPGQEIYSTSFSSLSGWTVTGSVSTNSSSSDTCAGGGGSNAHFAGNGTITRAISTGGFAGIRLEADFRGGAAYTDPGQCLKWWYSVDNGANWILAKAVCGLAIPNGTWTCASSFDYPAAADGQSDFRIRFETTGGVDVRLDRLLLEGGAPACDVEDHVKVELAGPGGGVWIIKDLGQVDPPKPIDVTSFYTSGQGGTGLWRIELEEASGGTSTLTSTTLAVTDAPPAECDVSAACACPPGPPGEVSDDPSHFLALAKNGPNVDLRFEDLGAPSYNVYVSTAPGTAPFGIAGGLGKKDCGVATATAPAGMRSITAYSVESGIATASDLHFILVTADDGGTLEGVAGYRSSGAPRAIDSTCN